MDDFWIGVFLGAVAVGVTAFSWVIVADVSGSNACRHVAAVDECVQVWAPK